MLRIGDETCTGCDARFFYVEIDMETSSFENQRKS